MKSTGLVVWTIFLITITAAPAVWGQTGSDSSRAKRQKHIQAKQNLLIDENGNGIDDRTESKGRRLRQGKDNFIDKDGDGICDGRATGLGFRRGAAGIGNQGGKKLRQGGRP